MPVGDQSPFKHNAGFLTITKPHTLCVTIFITTNVLMTTTQCLASASFEIVIPTIVLGLIRCYVSWHWCSWHPLLGQSGVVGFILAKLQRLAQTKGVQASLIREPLPAIVTRIRIG